MDKRRGVAWSLVALAGVVLVAVLRTGDRQGSVEPTTVVRDSAPFEHLRAELQPPQRVEERSLAAPAESTSSSEAAPSGPDRPSPADGGEPLVRGRVTDADSVPVPDACVLLLDPRSDELLTMASTDEDGTFELLDPGLPAIVLVASHPGVGVSGKVTHERGAGEASGDVGDVSLLRGGRLGGSLLLPDGNPIAHAPIRAFPTEHDRSVVVHAGGVSPRRAAARLEALPGGATTTDENGRFLFRGLVPGPYALEVELGRSSRPFGGAYRTGEERLRLVLERYEVQIRLSSAKGEELRGVRASTRSWRDAPQELWTAVQHGVERPEEWRHLRSRNNPWKEVTRVHLAEPGEVFRVDAVASGHDPASAVLLVREGAYDSSLELVLQPSPGVPCTGTLRLSIPRLVPERLSVRLEITRPDGALVLRRKIHGSAEPVKLRRLLGFEGRCGRYRLDATLTGDEGQYCLPFRTDFELREGRETSLPVLFDPAGRLVVKLVLPRSSPGARREKGTCEVRSSDRRRHEVMTFPGRRVRGRGLSFPSLPPGPYEVSIDYGDGPAVVEQVHVRAGRSSVLPVDLSGRGASEPRAR